MMALRKVGQVGCGFVLGVMAMASPAHADSGYQPYYYVPTGQAQAVAPLVQAPAPVAVSSGVVDVPPAPVVVQSANDMTRAVVPDAPLPVPQPVANVPTSAVVDQPRLDVAMVQPPAAPAPVAMPSYSYQQPEPRAFSAPRPVDPKPKMDEVKEPMTLGTMGGLDGTLMASMYHYHELPHFMNLVGFKGGAELQATGKYNDMFFTADARYASGTSNYHGGVQDRSGNELFAAFSGQNPENMWDLRGLVGRDFIHSRWSISPYLGFGYRYLFADGRATVYDPTRTISVAGYRRENQLYYSPFGFKARYRVMPQSRISTMVEYDHVWGGLQTSFLSDASGTDFNNHQGSGRGWRTELMWETPTWAFGPFANYWNIDESDFKCLQDLGGGACAGAVEPHNWTYEVGLQFRYHLLNF